MHTYMWAMCSKSRAPRSFNPITYYLMFIMLRIILNRYTEMKKNRQWNFRSLNGSIRSAARCLCFTFYLVSIQFIISILSPSIHVPGVVVSVDSLATRIFCFCFLCNQKNIRYLIFVYVDARL